jgi:hypothetical protein
MQEQGVSIEDHPTFTQLLVRLVIVVGELGDPDTIFYLLDSLKCLALNEEGLLETSRFEDIQDGGLETFRSSDM